MRRLIRGVFIAVGALVALVVLGIVQTAVAGGRPAGHPIDGARFRSAYSTCRLTFENLSGRPMETGSPADDACYKAARDEARTP